MSWIALLYVFFLAHVKFLVTATIAFATYPQLSVDEVFLASSLGAISCFNIFYFISKKVYFGDNKKSASPKNKKRKIFKRRNRILIKMKQSKTGFLLVCTCAPLFLSIPIGTVVTVKFFGDDKKTYWYVSILLVVMAFLLAYLNDSIFTFFE